MAKMIGSAAGLCFVACSLLLVSHVVRAADSIEPDPVAISDPVEREFEARLQDLRKQQKTQTRQLQERKDLTPEQRLEKRRALVSEHQKELHSLEAEYQGRLTPEARSRWMERKANRQKKFDKLHRGTKEPSKTGTQPSPGGK
jgi:hypothetical protein